LLIRRKMWRVVSRRMEIGFSKIALPRRQSCKT
jgi:hypothetical protein